ncbi:MAG: S49 family peptidase, partial [Rhodospirillales bacterium]|nr:S49 family peptidase [Rhodospirillales bacterium]
MSLETDLIVDRRRLTRRLVFWRSFAVVAVVAALLVAFRVEHGPLAGAHLARLSVTGIITEDRKLTEAVDALAKDDGVKALIVSINSPGGSVAGGESLHDAIARVAAKKPVVAVMGGLAASAGYMVALPAHRIYAREATLTGSIGVLLESAEISGLLAKVGITPQVLQGLVMDMYDQFVTMVAAGRHMDPARVRELADGRAYTGRQALPLGLVDAIGDETTARAWLAKEKDVSAALPVEDVSTSGFAGRALAG